MAMAMAMAPGWECNPIRGGERAPSPREGGERDDEKGGFSSYYFRRFVYDWDRTDSSTRRRFGSVVGEWWSVSVHGDESSGRGRESVVSLTPVAGGRWPR